MRAVGPVSRDVAGPVEPRSRRRVERVRNESFVRQIGPVQIASRQARTANVDLTLHADGNRLLLLVQQKYLRVPDRSSDRHLARPDVGSRCAGEIAHGRHDGRFGGAVGIDQSHAGSHALLPCLQAVGTHALAADDDAADRRRQGVARPTCRSPAPARASTRSAARRPSPPTTAHCSKEYRRRRQHRLGSQHQCRPARERRENFLHAGVEIDRRELQHVVVGRQPVLGAGEPDEIDDGPMFDQRALRRAGRAGRVDDIGEVMGRGSAVGRALAFERRSSPSPHR